MRGTLLRACLVAALALSAGDEARAEPVDFAYVWGAPGLEAGQSGGVRLWTGPVPAVMSFGSALLGAAAPAPLEAVWPLGVETPAGAAPLTLDVRFPVTFTFYPGGDRYGDLTVAGRLHGTLGPSSSTMRLTFSGPGSVRLDDLVYRVWIDSVEVPPAPERSGVQLIPRVTVTAAAHAPEPSSLALAGAAGLTALAARWLRRRGGRRG